jgi:hypothetical protein
MMVHALYKDNQYWIYAGLPTIIANVRRYGSVGAASRWRVFLQSWCDAGLSGYYFIVGLAKTVTPKRECPRQRASPYRYS